MSKRVPTDKTVTKAKSARATTKRKSSLKKTAGKSAAASSHAIGAYYGPDSEARRAMIADAAYYRAERRGFGHGGELDDWLEAEREVERRLGE